MYLICIFPFFYLGNWSFKLGSKLRKHCLEKNCFLCAEMENIFTDDWFMKEAIKEAKKAFDLGEVPVGAVVVYENKIIGKGHNLTEQLQDVTAHAEMQAITAAANHIGAKYLTDCKLYVTLEPCTMCAGAIFWSQPAELIYGASDSKRGFQNLGKTVIHPKTTIKNGILHQECSELLKDFFKTLR
jgi:tRNA(adenine34) deaminase